MSTMQEIELKFQIPATSLKAVQAELVNLPGGQEAPLPLRAAYFDTPQRHLAAARMALRVRQEGHEWVQTLKAGGSHTMMRLEDNRPFKPVRKSASTTADLSRHLGTPAQAALEQVLSWQPRQDPSGAHTGLIELYRTDIHRTRARLTVGQGTPHEGEVELALDLGAIHAGDLNVPVRELEIELISGHPMAVIEAGRDWVARHGLWLDTQTKAHRGDRLARHAAQPPSPDQTASLPAEAVLARPAKIKPDATLSLAWRAGLESCLEHIGGNMSELGTAPADISAPAYQWRLGLRRLRAMGRLFAKSSAPLPASALELAATLSDQLGQWRDAQALAWLPAKIQAKGGPTMDLPVPDACAVDDQTVIQLARSLAATALCLHLLATLVSTDAALSQSQADDPPFTPWLSSRLRKWQARCAATSHRSHHLNDADLHRLRKQGKRLRLVADLYATLWPGKKQARHDRALHAALTALGRIQDEAVAQAWYRQAEQEQAANPADATWVVAWLEGRHKSLQKRAQRALHRWMKVKTPW